MAGISVSLDGANIQLSFQKDDQATAVVMDARAARALVRAVGQLLTAIDDTDEPDMADEMGDEEVAMLDVTSSAIEIGTDDEGQAEEWPAVPFVQLGLTAGQVEQIAEEEDEQQARLTTSRLLLDATVLSADRESAALFGRPTLPADEPFGQVFKRTVQEGETPDWLTSLAEQVTRAAQWTYPAVHWSLMRSANEYDHTWYSPVLTHVRRSPSKAMEFDIYFQRFAGPPGARSISLSLPDSAVQETDASGVSG